MDISLYASLIAFALVIAFWLQRQVIRRELAEEVEVAIDPAGGAGAHAELRQAGEVVLAIAAWGKLEEWRIGATVS